MFILISRKSLFTAQMQRTSILIGFLCVPGVSAVKVLTVGGPGSVGVIGLFNVLARQLRRLGSRIFRDYGLVFLQGQIALLH